MVSACIKEIFKKDDIAVSSHRAHAHYIGKGGDLKNDFWKFMVRKLDALKEKVDQCTCLI